MSKNFMKILLSLILLTPSLGWGLTFKNGEQVNSTKYMYCKQINTGEVTKIEWKTFNCPTGYKKTNASDYERNKKKYGQVAYCINNSTGKVLESRSGLCLKNYSITSKQVYENYTLKSEQKTQITELDNSKLIKDLKIKNTDKENLDYLSFKDRECKSSIDNPSRIPEYRWNWIEIKKEYPNKYLIEYDFPYNGNCNGYISKAELKNENSYTFMERWEKQNIFDAETIVGTYLCKSTGGPCDKLKYLKRGDGLYIKDKYIDSSKKTSIKVETKDNLIGYVSWYALDIFNQDKFNFKKVTINENNNYRYCWDFYKYKDKYNLNYITSRKGDCLVSEKEIEPYWCNDKSIKDPKLLEGCENNNSTKKIVKKNNESIKKLEIVVESNQIQDEIAPQIACNEIGIIKTGLANIKCKISDDNELFAVVVNGKQIKGNLENLNEQIQVPFGNSKIEVVAYDSFGNQENLILNVNREFSLVNSQEEIEQLFPGKIKDKSSNNKVAVIIGIQNYADIPDTKYSDKDAMAFAEFANQTLNIPSKNIKYLFNEDAKYFGFKGIQTWLENKVNKNTDVYVFYSGHGLGVEGKSKLLPSDFVTQFQEESSYEKDEFLSDIANLNPNHIYAFFDTCFSGLGRNGETLVAGLKNISIVEDVAPVDNITIFNSSSGLEYSTDFDEAGHGLFSYYLMKGLEGNADINSDNEITSKELFSFISDNVSDRALDIGLSQNPSLIGESNNVIVRW